MTETRFIRILQKDIITKPEKWTESKPGKFIQLSDKAKNVYCVLSVIAYSTAGNAKGESLSNGHKLGKDWFWTSHKIVRQLTGSGQKTVQRGISELKEAGFIEYHPSRSQGKKCYFKIKGIKYNTGEAYTESKPKAKPLRADNKGFQTGRASKYGFSPVHKKKGGEDCELSYMYYMGHADKLTPEERKYAKTLKYYDEYYRKDETEEPSI
jgi:hypothetical protein